MEKTLSTIAVTTFVIMSTAAFGYAEYISVSMSKYPFFHLGCLIVGGLIIISLKNRFRRFYVTQAVGAFALFTATITLFTQPIIDTFLFLVG